MKETLMKLKTFFLYGLLISITLFVFLWFVDTLSSSFNPEYRPLLGFLQIANSLLQTIIGM